MQLIITLQLAGIAALIAAPSVRTFSAQYQLSSASNQLGFDIVRARMQAVGQNQFVRIRMLSGVQYVRETSTNGSTWSNQVTKNLPSGVTATPTSAQVQFDKRGFATVNNSVTLSNSLGRVKTVATSIIGRVTVA